MNQRSTSYLIIGAGIIGLTIARELVARGAKDILIIEKESRPGVHASGRNSGVLHAGIYYHSDTNKARYCQQGSKLMKQFCHARGLPICSTKKVVVTRSEQEITTLNNLYVRAQANGATVSMIDQQELREVEPLARSVEHALLSHDTAVVNPNQVMMALVDELAENGVAIQLGCAFLSRISENCVKTNQGAIEFQFCINAAGSYAEVIAQHFGLGHEYRSLPFKGTYKKFIPTPGGPTVNGNIYPVPDLRNPFLGVHFTRSAAGEIYVGPTAIPCFGRENYQGVRGVGAELLPVLFGSAHLFFTNPGFRRVALTEPRKYLLEFLYRDAKKIVKQLDKAQLHRSTKVGIRPQLIHWPSKTLVMDFLFEKTHNSLHVLNAISPAFTCSMAMARDLVADILA